MAAGIQCLPLIFLGVVLNTVAQIFLKMGATSIGYFDFSLNNIRPVLFKLLTTPTIIGGISIYVLSVVIWIMALSRVEVSYAYPLTSMGYILTALAGHFLLQESMTPSRIFGIFMIMIGVYFVARSS
ncbi:MAG: EamA family transporter [Alphaproteobacteria bacterium]|jgi:drug/metabolite transporter (DMT)-like permease